MNQLSGPQAIFKKQATGGDNVILATRLRLARNVEGYRFCLSKSTVIWQTIAAALTAQKLTGCELDQAPIMGFSHEAQLQYLVYAAKKNIWVGGPDEDHIRLVALQQGLAINELFTKLRTLDHALSQSIPYAWDAQFGYLTACPSNLGTAMRISFLVHVRGLLLADRWTDFKLDAARRGLLVRPWGGEAAQCSESRLASRELYSAFYEISHRSSLGHSDVELKELMLEFAQEIQLAERQARQQLWQKQPDQLKDWALRAFGLLKHAWQLELEETHAHLSILDLARDWDLFSGRMPQMAWWLEQLRLLKGQKGIKQQALGRNIASLVQKNLKLSIIETA